MLLSFVYQSAKENCKGAYTEAPNRECKDDLDAIEKVFVQFITV